MSKIKVMGFDKRKAHDYLLEKIIRIKMDQEEFDALKRENHDLKYLFERCAKMPPGPGGSTMETFERIFHELLEELRVERAASTNLVHILEAIDRRARSANSLSGFQDIIEVGGWAQNAIAEYNAFKQLGGYDGGNQKSAVAPAETVVEKRSPNRFG